ncbi:phage portal protein [Paracidovorax valerianellae]|uniref:phage portal protein n=1 Tax=Paracidovorax valerianellae TaxID=187868 RepID=UPI002303A99D|nr:phage portal protein [Paracidovorax valerianellae]MDA8444748.1 phage portal protein [Paracidovorax valerianellae]UYL85504.1 portal vertex protein [Acidovorax phage Alfacinha1]
MTKRNRRHSPHAPHSPASVEPANTAPDAAAPQAQSFTFDLGDPEPVIGGRSALLEYAECMESGDWYEPPVSLAALARLLRVGAHHESALRFKVNVLASTFVPSQWLSAESFRGLALDFLVLGNGYLERRRNRLGDLLELRHVLGKYARRGIKAGRFFFVTDLQTPHEFPEGDVFQLREQDIHQEIYGLPPYLGALQSAMLNESATLFRRRYYNNGSHAGFILYVTDPAQKQSDVDQMRAQLTKTKGMGNFRNLFYYAPNGKKDGIQLIPISEVAAKDDFLSIKNTSRDDVLAAHRVPPQLMGMLPNNVGGFGDVEKAAMVFARNEIAPLQATMAHAVNTWAGVPACGFRPYLLTDAPNAPALVP